MKQDKEIIIEGLLTHIRSLEDVIETANTIANNCCIERAELKSHIDVMIKNENVLLNEIKELKAQIQEFKDKEEDRAVLNEAIKNVEIEVKEKRKYNRKA